ncbi:hypothetical protein MAPG_02037 [Magnaporthiopsis poae ATCC 64411]|uniref:Uncharacterized protein n=1 Tax=Magnaporthiopsis poae (strain ATCC 64411 / 73-15) TaxID=644358 RepID=A0A0C4DQ99_MAGP6|nr:hypothetical protein MAPG_02037 [Magnaporthiopsis poae ATCC 64411]
MNGPNDAGSQKLAGDLLACLDRWPAEIHSKECYCVRREPAYFSAEAWEQAPRFTANHGSSSQYFVLTGRPAFELSYLSRPGRPRFRRPLSSSVHRPNAWPYLCGDVFTGRRWLVRNFCTRLRDINPPVLSDAARLVYLVGELLGRLSSGITPLYDAALLPSSPAWRFTAPRGYTKVRLGKATERRE